MTITKKWACKRITINLASGEAEKLDSYCNQTGRPATDVIRELIRGLPVTPSLNYPRNEKPLVGEQEECPSSQTLLARM